jgi:hypothetical protein
VFATQRCSEDVNGTNLQTSYIRRRLGVTEMSSAHSITSQCAALESLPSLVIVALGDVAANARRHCLMRL